MHVYIAFVAIVGVQYASMGRFVAGRYGGCIA